MRKATYSSIFTKDFQERNRAVLEVLVVVLFVRERGPNGGADLHPIYALINNLLTHTI